jgi:predicted  nucleic acid-binding Zn-ribbon protein
MTPTPQRAEPLPPATDAAETLELTSADLAPRTEFEQEPWLQPSEDHEAGAAERGTGGRQVLGVALSALAILWVAYSAWSAGRTLSGQPLSSPLVPQWLAIAAGPLALLGLAWLIFGRTRRKEAERFTQSVIAMRGEARSLEALLEVLSQRINDSRSELTMIAQHLMQLGDEATGKLGGITQEFDSSTDKLKRHGEALDRAAESARNDLAVLLEDLPRAEESTRSIAEQLRSIGSQSADSAAAFGRQIDGLADRTREADQLIAEATERLTTRLSDVEMAGKTAAMRVGDAEKSLSGVLEALLERTSVTLDEIRSGIDVQSAAVAALVEQASAGIGKSGAEAAETLAANVDYANASLETLSGRVAEQDRASQRMIAEIDRGLAMIDERFTELAAHGDERANRFLESLTRARTELDSLADQASSQDTAIGSLAERTAALHEAIGRLAGDIRDGLGIAIGEAQGGADRLAEAAAAARPEIAWIRDAAVEAGERLSATSTSIAEQQDRFAALLASVDDGVGDAQSKLTELASLLAQVEREAADLSGSTAPALVASLVQVREAAAHAAERAREAIEGVIPESAGKLSQETRDALERAIREGIEDRLREVETVAARAVDSARAASDRLTQQMLTLGQSAAALEQHIEHTNQEQREKDSEAFARRVSLLLDSMHSAAIDVGKILSDEIDDKAWGAYLKGNRGVFTSRAVRLIGGSETRAIRAHYESDLEFQRSVNRYVHDFEAMLRRVMAERDGGIIAVTLMSSDTGKLYAALSQAIDKRR